MIVGKSWANARSAYWAVLIAGFALVLLIDLPGHLTTDSITALHEGRFHEHGSLSPAFYSWLIGQTDRLVRGTAAYVVLSCGLLLAAWAGLAVPQRRASWLAPAGAALVFLAPDVLIFQGIVWKDVFFANVSVLGFVCIALAAHRWASSRPWLLLGLAAVMLAIAALVRQNGIVLWPPAVLAVALAVQPRRLLPILGWTAGWCAVLVGLTVFLSATALPQGVGKPDQALGTGLRMLQQYDIIGAAAREPQRPLTHIARADALAEQYLRERSRLSYSPIRIDTLDPDPTLTNNLWALPKEVVRDEWLDLIVKRPGLYLKDRWEVFRWVFATPRIDDCSPVAVGVSGPPGMMKDLQIAPSHDTPLYNYSTYFLDTPVVSHVAYAVIALAAMGLLIWRRRPADLGIAAMLAGALAFVASFFVISVACDYRYLYFLDLAAITAVLYLLLDPRLRPRQAD